MCSGFRRYKVGSLSDNTLLSGLLNIISIFVPFITLISLNGAIVLMLRRQHIQQLRSLITELTMGPDIMKLRRRNIRSATNTLIVIITAYLISNLLNMMITLFEFFWPDFLHTEHRQLYRIVTDTASVLTVVGNAIRCPAHLVSNKDIRQHFGLMLFGESNKVSVLLLCIIRFIKSLKVVIAPPLTRRLSQKVEAPWISLLIVPNETPRPSYEFSSFSERLRRLSANIALRYSSSNPLPSNNNHECRRNTFCYGNRLNVPESDTLIELVERAKSDDLYENSNSISSNCNGAIIV
ncbi:unnamed protein product [Toxocara canis]|uniref:G_PROTEIN_RECEP_F1_2 domain-containing protein n=1 Tax=Toxocara canis TaxID=6265 RepID=A0A183V5D9_TOXCA|nr:unnamed protein product [Toxocara canis]